MRDFSYAAAASVDEAVSLLAAHGERANILAGGTDLIVQLREGHRDADFVLDVKKIPELMASSYDPAKGWTFGAGVPCHRIYEDRSVAAAYPAIADAARIIGGWQIQSRASLGGNVCNASPAADSTPALIAQDAVCEIAGPRGRRRVAVADFCSGPGKNVLARGELLVAFHVPPPDARSASAYLRFIPRNEMDIAVVGVGCWLRLNATGEGIEAARIALGAVAPTAKLAHEAGTFLVGNSPSPDNFFQAGELAKTAASPISDKRGTAEYRLHLIGVLVKRTLALALERALKRSTS